MIIPTQGYDRETFDDLILRELKKINHRLERIEQYSQPDKTANVLLEIKDEIKTLKTTQNNNEEWLNASAFCRKFGISRPTLTKRVESGLVEKKNFDEATPRYRWVKGGEM